MDSTNDQGMTNQKFQPTENNRIKTIKKVSHSSKMDIPLTKTNKHHIDIKDSIITTSLKQRYEPTELETPLEAIRKDPKRIYLDKTFVVGDLTYSIRNVSEHGVELYVSNSDTSYKTYYFPKVEVEGNISKFYGTVIPPSGNSYGWIFVPNIKNKRKLDFQFSSIGGESRKKSVKLEW